MIPDTATHQLITE